MHAAGGRRSGSAGGSDSLCTAERREQPSAVVREREGAIRFSSQQPSIHPEANLKPGRTVAVAVPPRDLHGRPRLSAHQSSGTGFPGLSATTTQRLKESRKEDHRQRVTWDLSKTYVYLWAEGIHFIVRMGDATHCVLVVIGATADEKKERLAIQDGDRESEQSWKELLLDLKRRGLPVDTKRAIGDGVLGVWKALSQVVGDTLEQRCGPTRWPTSPRPRASSTRSG